MIITSVPARELVEILRTDNYFDVYCFVLVREIQGKELLLDLFRHHSSFHSVSGNRMLIVLFSESDADMSTVREAKREIYSEQPGSFGSMYHHNCRDVAIRLVRAMRHYEWQHAMTNGGTLGYSYDSLDHVGRFAAPVPGSDLSQLGIDRYLESMTRATDGLKDALNISEADLPCLVFADKGFSELSVLHLLSNDEILVVYDAIRELVIRNCERRSKIHKLEGEIRHADNELKSLSSKKRRHSARIESVRAQLAKFETDQKRLEKPEGISSIISGLERKRAIRTNASHMYRLFSSTEVPLKILEILKSFFSHSS